MNSLVVTRACPRFKERIFPTINDRILINSSPQSLKSIIRTCLISVNRKTTFKNLNHFTVIFERYFISSDLTAVFHYQNQISISER